jgi:class 3 adenylate cyclase
MFLNMYLIMVIPVIIGVLSTSEYKIYDNLSAIYSFLGPLVCLFLNFIGVYKKQASAIYFITGFLFAIINTVIFYLAFVRQILPINNFTENTIKIGLTGFMIMQAIAVAAYFNEIRKNKLLADQELIAKMKFNEKLRAKSIKKKRKLIHAYERFFPHKFLTLLNKKSIINISLGDHVEKNMAILISDIRNFTTILEKMTPEESFQFINNYLDKAGKIIRAEGGFIDRYIGDAIKATFDLSVSQAIRAAIQLFQIACETSSDAHPINIGVGINYGLNVIGTIGDNTRMDASCIGDAVDISSQLESLNKIYGTNAIISEDAINQLDHAHEFHFRFIDYLYLKHKSYGTKIYEIVDVNLPDIFEKKQLVQQDFDLAINLYQAQQFNDALTYFKKLQLILPDDKVIALYINRCEYFLKNGSDTTTWEPIATVTQEIGYSN